MASVWISTRKTKSGVRHRVLCQLGGRGTRTRYLGSFGTKREAEIRRRWAEGELAALRVPNPKAVLVTGAPALRRATEEWRAARIEVSEGTRTNDRINTERVFEHDSRLATTPVDELDAERWANVFKDLGADFKRGTLKKSKEAFAMVYDHCAIDPNPLRDRRVKLPYEEAKDEAVPLAPHVTEVAHLLPAYTVLPYLLIDWTALRVGAVEGAKIGELDEHRKALLAKASTAKNRKPIWVDLHPALFDAIVAQLPAREDRDLDAPLFGGFNQANLRAAITRACRLSGTPHHSPHGLRKRRASLLLKEGKTLAEVAERLGDSEAVTSKHYLYVLGDYEEVDYAAILAGRSEVTGRTRTVRTPVRTQTVAVGG